MAERNTAIVGKQLKAAIAADGLQKDASQNLAIDVSDFAGTGLEDDGSENLRIAAEGVTLAMMADMAAEANILIADSGLRPVSKTVSGDITITAAGVTAIGSEKVLESMMDIESAPTDGYILYYNDETGIGKLDYIDPAAILTSLAGVVLESDIICNEIPTGDINSSNTEFVLANTPETGSVSVFLNGLLQQPGGGEDYTISGSTITFVAAPDTNDILLVNYIKATN